MLHTYQLALLFIVGAVGIHAKRIGPDGPANDRCPVLFRGECYKIFQTRSAFTRTSGDRFCNAEAAKMNATEGHLADIYSRNHFKKIVQYVKKYDEPRRIRNPDVLLGMTYDTENKVIHYYNTNVARNRFWKADRRMLSWGEYMVLRVSQTKDSSTQIRNWGDANFRFKRVMCQYNPK